MRKSISFLFAFFRLFFRCADPAFKVSLMPFSTPLMKTARLIPGVIARDLDRLVDADHRRHVLDIKHLGNRNPHDVAVDMRDPLEIPSSGSADE